MAISALGASARSAARSSLEHVPERPTVSRARSASARIVSRGIVFTVGTYSWAFAQTAPPEVPPALEEVVVTGSRIPVPANITATSPMQVVTSREIALEGHTDVVDVLNTLPQTTISATNDYGNHSNPANTAGGIATADLRGLGPQRTVVLINGRRLGLGDPNTGDLTPAPDLDQIPTALIERVEVLTGGASTTYGSDAIAGVVNFIMKKNFEDIQIEGQYGFDQHEQHASFMDGPESAAGITPPTGSIRDGYKRDLSLLMGTDIGDGAGNITGYFIYHDQDGVTGSHRDFADCDALSKFAVTGLPTQTGFTCHGSAISNLFAANGGAGPVYSVVGHEFLPYPAAGSVPPPRFSFAPYESAQRQDTRNQAGILAHWDVNESAKPYLELAFMDDRTRTQLAPSGIFPGQNPFTSDGTYRVNCSNPLLSSQEAAALCTPAQIAADKASPGSVSADLDIGRRNIEGGGRDSTFGHENYRAVAGMTGSLNGTWTYDAYYLYYYTNLFQSNLDYLNIAAVDHALQVKTNASGQPVCIVGGSCVPYDIFTTGAVTTKQLSYLYEDGTDHGDNSEQIAHIDVTGHLGDYGLTAPWARDAVALNAGAEHRTETLDFAPDAAELSGNLAGYGGASVPIHKGYSVSEGFLETRVPIAQDRPASHDLVVDAGYRYSEYSTAGVTNTYKFELQYAPLPDFRLRYSYDRVVRAPNLIELYTPLVYGISNYVMSDPCAPRGAMHATASLANCEHTGVTAAQYGNGFGPSVGGTDTIPQCYSGYCGQVTGGNPHLAPEVADTWSVGLSLTPTALPELTGSIDYYQIYLKKEIGQVPQLIILAQCLATGNPTYCGDVVRTARGALTGATVAGGGYILQPDVNTGAALVSGVDVQANYRRPLAVGWGTLSASLTGAWEQHNSVAPYAGAESYDCAGLFGNTCLDGSVNPSWRHNLRLSWETPWKLLLSAQWRFIGRSFFDNNSSQPALYKNEEGVFDPLVTRIPNYSYLDVTAIWTLARGIELRAGINNLLDKDPPFLPEYDVSVAAGSFNTFPTYDLLGREIFAAFRAKF